jgi:hypothetical protein
MVKAIRYDVKQVSSRKQIIHTVYDNGEEKWQSFTLDTIGPFVGWTKARPTKFTYSLVYDRESKSWTDSRKQETG